MTQALNVQSRESQLDGTSTEYFELAPTEDNLTALIRTLFEEHWPSIVFGSCIQGSVFELRFASQPRVSFLDGYFTIGDGGEAKSHFHLCVGTHKGTRARPTPPELAAWRRCARAAFYRDSDISGRHSSWGLRLWNGRGEQMITVFFPNPWLNAEGTKRMKEPDWTRRSLWLDLRARFAGIPAESEPQSAERPIICG